MDALTYAKLFAKDDQGNSYLSEEVIEAIREVDMPEEEEARLKIRKIEANR